MLATRFMPCLLLRQGALVKTRQFKAPQYVGDPINAVRIYNDKEVDELILLDITATTEGRRPDLALLHEIASECFMPIAYGGGVSTLGDMEAVFGVGVEKVALNTAAIERPDFLADAARRFGSQSLVVSLDVRRTRPGRYQAYTRSGSAPTGLSAVVAARRLTDAGAGELLLTAIDREGTMSGYDLDLIRQVTDAVGVPVIALGGAGGVSDLVKAVQLGGASAAAAGSLAVFYGSHRAVLINFPSRQELMSALEGAAAEG